VIQRSRSRGIGRREIPKAAAESGVPGFNFIHIMLPRLRDEAGFRDLFFVNFHVLHGESVFSCFFWLRLCRAKFFMVKLQVSIKTMFSSGSR
jgi:hypothetical protein